MVICVFSGTLNQEAGKYLISIFQHCDIDCPDGETHQVKGENKRKMKAAFRFECYGWHACDLSECIENKSERKRERNQQSIDL